MVDKNAIDDGMFGQSKVTSVVSDDNDVSHALPLMTCVKRLIEVPIEPEGGRTQLAA